MQLSSLCQSSHSNGTVIENVIGVVYQDDECSYLQQIHSASIHTLQAFLNGSLDDSPGRVYALENAPLGGTYDPLWLNE